MKLDVPYYSQFKDVTDPEWRLKACTIANLKMALEYALGAPAPSIDELIKEGLLIRGYGPHGWIHDAIVNLAHNHGVPAYREEFRSVAVDTARSEFSRSKYEDSLLSYSLEKFRKKLSAGALVIASTPRNWAPDGNFHTTLLVGYKEKNGALSGFYYHDPDAPNEPKKDQFVDVETFKEYWRRLAIFFEKE
ncbi:hypothetical protein EPN83_01620 [Patescibacteria group bacterium]|nr:MAG: hypothetical protein EPN83_01620 [Patescibacteria group bacterium]